MTSNTDRVQMYTDGSCHGNPGPGGYACVLKYHGKVKEISEGFADTTNNRMEVMAVIAGLKAMKAKGTHITVYSDSKYVVSAFNKGWIKRWAEQGIENRTNGDLWKELIGLVSEHYVDFEWVKGHDGHPENERCDYLANKAAFVGPLKEDKGFKQ